MRITVIGEAVRRISPERATLALEISSEAETPEEALERTTAAVREITAAIDELASAPRSPLAEHAVLPIVTRSWRPWTPEGESPQRRFAASARVRLTFREHPALAAFIARWGARDEVQVQGVDWSLTERRRREIEAEVLAAAVGDALERARVIAAAAGWEGVALAEVADVGLLGAGAGEGPGGFGAESAGGPMLRAAFSAKAADAGEGIDLTPEDIEVRVRVHARCEAG